MNGRSADDMEGVIAFVAAHTSDVIVRYNAIEGMTYISPTVRRYGYEPADVVAGKHSPLVHPDDAERLTAIDAALLRGELDPEVRREHRFRTASGEWVWMEGNPHLVFDDDGKVVEVVNILRDITHRRELEARARAEAEQFEAAFRHAAIGMALVGLDGRFLRLNEAFCRFVGYSEAEMLALDFQSITHPEDLNVDLEQLKQLTSGAFDTYRLEKRYVRKDGREVWGHLSVSLVRGPDGAPRHYVSQVQDLTEERGAQAALKASEARYRELAEASEDVTTQLDLQGVITYISPAAQAYGYDPQTLIGRRMGELIHADDLEQVRSNFVQLAMGLSPTAMQRQTRVRTAAGEWVWMEGNAQPIRDASGAVTGFVTTLRNVTERREQEALFEAAFQNSAMGKTMVDLDGTILRVNAATCRMMGYAEEELQARPLDDLIHPDEYGADEPNSQRLLAGEIDSYESTRRYRRADGAYLWVRMTVGLVRGANGAPKHFVAEVEDLTERREQEALFEAAFEHSALGKCLVSLEGRTLRANAAACAILGYSEAQLQATPADDILHPDDVQTDETRAQRLMKGEIDSYQMERRLLHSGGAYVWTRMTVGLVRFADGSPKHFVIELEDLTERHAAEAALKASEERYRLIAENTSDMIIMSDLNGRATYVSQAIRQAGRRPEDLEGRSFAESVHPEDLPKLVKAFQRLAKGGRPERVRWRGVDQTSGGWSWLESNPSLVRDPATGAATGFLDVIRNVQVQVEQEEALGKATAALQHSEARYRLIGENTSDIIVMAEPNGRIEYISPSVATIGYTPEELIGAAFVKQMHPEDLTRVWPALKDLPPGATSQRMRWRAQHKTTGEWIWLESQPTMLKDPQTGGPAGFLDVVRDVSLQVQQEEALASARAEAEEAATAKSQFLANMSHEIRTPLTAVLGFTSLLSDLPDLPETAVGYVDRIDGAGKGLLAIVNDILDFSKLEAGKFEIRPRPTDVAALCEETLHLFSTQAESKGLSLALEMAPDVPRAAMLDGDRLRQTLINLIGNGIKFTEVGGVTLRVAASGDERIRVEVSDTGLGLDADAQARLFQRFSQVDSSMTRRHGGTGLGLAICKGVAEAMGGEIGVESTLGEGATFFMVLPAPAVEAPQELSGDEAPLSIDGTRVFLVDDNATNRELARRILEAAGAEVHEACDGVEAVERLGLLPVDVVLMDLRMPKLDGRGALAQLRAQPGPNQSVPVLAFTADADLAGEHDLDGFDGLVRKPIQPLELYGTIAAATQWPLEDEDMSYAAG